MTNIKELVKHIFYYKNGRETYDSSANYIRIANAFSFIFEEPDRKLFIVINTSNDKFGCFYSGKDGYYILKESGFIKYLGLDFNSYVEHCSIFELEDILEKLNLCQY